MKSVSVLVAAMVAATCLYAEHAIIGTWKQNRAKVERSTEANVISIQSTKTGVTITSAVGKWFTAGFNGEPTPMAVNPNDTVMLKRLGSHAFEWTLVHGGKPRQLTRFEVSPDGKSMTSTVTAFIGDVRQENAVVSTYKRVGGTGTPNPFDGSWESNPRLTQHARDDVFTARQQGDLLTISEPHAGIETTVNLKTGDAKMSGPAALVDGTLQARVLDNRTLEVKMSRGKWQGTSVFTVSADNQTLTQRDVFKAAEGKEVQNVLVYERQ